MLPNNYTERIQIAVRYSLTWVAFAVIGIVFLVSSFFTINQFWPGLIPLHFFENRIEFINQRSQAAIAPVQLRIPSLDMAVGFEGPLGLETNREVAVPKSYDLLGWYEYAPMPGQLGPAVIIGHVDSRLGPAVFWPLGQIQVGADVYIDRADGTTAHFVVTELERPRQDAFPTAKVYGDLPYAGLRLITCSGTFVRGEQRYTHNLVVYARLVSIQKS